MVLQVLIPVVAMAALGLAFGLGLAYTLKLFSIEVDPTVALIISKLPGANCGACGKAGCAGFAEALRRGEAIPAACVVSKEETARQIAGILGVEFKPKEKKVAAVFCGGGRKARDQYLYQGIRGCRAASLILGGPKACAFGCLGLDDCARSCPYGAIRLSADDLPVIDPRLCTACGTCLKVCPKGLFALIPPSAAVHIACQSRDKAKKVVDVCQVGCIACGQCVKECPAQAITLVDNLARIDYEKCTSCGKCVEVCPRHIIAKWEVESGKEGERREKLKVKGVRCKV